MRATLYLVRRYLVFVPSLLLGVIGAVGLWFRPLPYEVSVTLWEGAGVVAALVAGLLGGAWLLEKTLPSFRHASKLLERALSPIRLSLPLIFFLAVASSVAEEVFFRGLLMPLIGVWGQALLFGLLHPATRRGWSYTAFTFVAGLAFGYATLLTGSLLPAIAAHFLINLQGFWEVRQVQKRKRRTAVPKPY